MPWNLCRLNVYYISFCCCKMSLQDVPATWPLAHVYTMQTLSWRTWLWHSIRKHTDNVFEEWITLWIVSVGITSRMWRKQKESDYFDSESFESDPDLQRCCHRVKIAYATPTSTPLSVESLLKVTKIKVCWIASNVPIRKIHSWYDFQVLAHPQKLALCELLLKM